MPCILEVVEILLEAVLKGLEVVRYRYDGGSVRCVLGVLLCMLFYMLLCILDATEGWLCLLEVLEVRRRWRYGGVGGAEELVVPEVIRCVLLCMLEAVEGKLCLWSCWRCRRCRR